MNIRKEGAAWTLELAKACTIAEVEADADRLREIPEDIQTITIDAKPVDEIDTAYFQLLLSLAASARARGVAFAVRDPSAALRQAGILYGIPLGEQPAGSPMNNSRAGEFQGEADGQNHFDC